MNHHYLGVLHSEVHVILLQERHLGKVTLQDALLYWDRVHFEREIVLHKHVELLQDCFELVSDIEGGFEVAVVEEVLVAPVDILVFPLVLEKGVHEGDVVSLLAHEFRLCVCCLAHLVLGAQEDVRRVQARDDRKHLVHALVFGRS